MWKLINMQTKAIWLCMDCRIVNMDNVTKLVQYIGNKNNPIVLRGLAAGCGAAELVGKKVVSGFCKVAEKAGKAAQTVWTVYDELNKAYGM